MQCWKNTIDRGEVKRERPRMMNTVTHSRCKRLLREVLGKFTNPAQEIDNDATSEETGATHKDWKRAVPIVRNSGEKALTPTRDRRHRRQLSFSKNTEWEQASSITWIRLTFQMRWVGFRYACDMAGTRTCSNVARPRTRVLRLVVTLVNHFISADTETVEKPATGA